MHPQDFSLTPTHNQRGSRGSCSSTLSALSSRHLPVRWLSCTGRCRYHKCSSNRDPFLNRGTFRFWPDVLFRITCAVGLAKGVSSGNKRYGFFVVHGHSAEGLANVAGSCQWIRLPVGAFRIDIDETHLYGGERVFKFPVAGISVVAKPFGFGAPVDVLFRFPYIFVTATESECLEAHGFECAIAGEDHQVRPRNLSSILLLDRP